MKMRGPFPESGDRRTDHEIRSEPPPPVSNRFIALAAMTVIAVTFVLLWWLWGVATQVQPPPGAAITPSPSVKIDAVRTALTTGAGIGGLIALLLAFRRQRHTEIQSRLTYESAMASEADATERRATELYSAGAEQLGSEFAAVRMAGLYALDRLGQSYPSQRGSSGFRVRGCRSAVEIGCGS